MIQREERAISPQYIEPQDFVPGVSPETEHSDVPHALGAVLHALEPLAEKSKLYGQMVSPMVLADRQALRTRPQGSERISQLFSGVHREDMGNDSTVESVIHVVSHRVEDIDIRLNWKYSVMGDDIEERLKRLLGDSGDYALTRSTHTDRGNVRDFFKVNMIRNGKTYRYDISGYPPDDNKQMRDFRMSRF